MARTYKRDSNGRFAGGGGGGGSKGGNNKPKASRKTTGSAAGARKPKSRGIEARIARSSSVQLDYTRSMLRPPGGSVGGKGQRQGPMSPSKLQHMAKRKRQQKQALANLYARLSPSSRKRADTAMRRSGIMNG